VDATPACRPLWQLTQPSGVDDVDDDQGVAVVEIEAVA
jgi:hypothetical protein